MAIIYYIIKGHPLATNPRSMALRYRWLVAGGGGELASGSGMFYDRVCVLQALPGSVYLWNNH